jgi:gliding motility-associated-like protein
MYEWTPVDEAGDVLNLTGLNSSGIYTVTVTDICGDQQTANVMVEVMPIEADFEAEELGASLFEFVATPVPECDPEDCPYTFIWDFGDGFTAEGPIVEHQFDGFSQYTTMLTVVNEIGCTSNAYYTVTAPVIIYIPNSFTPNNDGINDAWFVYGSNIREYECLIFNRWGDVIFESTDISKPWTGNNDMGEYYVPNGVYTYYVKVKGYEGDAFKRTGTVTLMR